MPTPTTTSPCDVRKRHDRKGGKRGGQGRQLWNGRAHLAHQFHVFLKREDADAKRDEQQHGGAAEPDDREERGG